MEASDRLQQHVAARLGIPGTLQDYMREMLARNDKKEFRQLFEVLPPGYWKMVIETRLEGVARK